MEKNNVSTYYDEYTERQIKAGISERHQRIHNKLLKFGLKPDSKVLEIGCGVGTQTKLIAEFVTKGSIVSVDISPKSIEAAKDRLRDYSNIEFFVADIALYDINVGYKFDLIVLPDVIEHIPIKDHFIIFKKFNTLLKKEGVILINIPNPYYLAWTHIHNKEALQVIDQPIYTNELVNNIYPNGFYIHFLKIYEIWTNNGDYQVIVLKKQENAIDFSPIEKEITLFDKVIFKLKLIFGIK